jgi:putative component of membrane protein insertase Oxa1/YidC/SpoIIIJ protein YidD
MVKWKVLFWNWGNFTTYTWLIENGSKTLKYNIHRQRHRNNHCDPELSNGFLAMTPKKYKQKKEKKNWTSSKLKTFSEDHHQDREKSWALVALTCNPFCWGGWDQKVSGAKEFARPHLNRKKLGMVVCTYLPSDSWKPKLGVLWSSPA